MRLEVKSLLFDVREACDLILQFTGKTEYAQYRTDAACRSAVERQFIVIGEALNRLGRFDSDLLNALPEHRAIINFRNVLVHGYDRVEDEVVWGIVRRHVPTLRDTIDRFLGDT